MWVEELENGKYKYVERYKDPLTQKWRKVSLTHTKKNNTVIKEMTRMLQDKIDQKTKSVTNVRLTFEELGHQWLEYHKHTVKRSTATRSETNLRALNAEIGHIDIESLSATHINKFYLENLKSERFKYNTVKQQNSMVKRVLKYAQKYIGVDMTSVINELEIPKINLSETNEFKYLEPNELKQLIRYFQNNNLDVCWRMAELLANTGMRFGELASISEPAINFDECYVDVEWTYDWDNKVFTEPKTGDERRAYFSPKMGDLLKEQIQLSRLQTIRYGHPKENKLLFKTRYGNPYPILSFNNRLKEAGIEGKNVTTHYFRHTFVTIAIERGMNKELIARQVGHADTHMIDKIYKHFSKGMEEQQKEAMLDFKII